MVLLLFLVAELEQSVVVFAVVLGGRGMVLLVVGIGVVGVFGLEFIAVVAVRFLGVLVVQFLLVYRGMVVVVPVVKFVLVYRGMVFIVLVLDLVAVDVFGKQFVAVKRFVVVFGGEFLLLVNGGVRDLIVLVAAGGPQSWRLGPSAFAGRLTA